MNLEFAVLRRSSVGKMVRGWKIVVSSERLGGGPPIKEYYLVAIADMDKAKTELRDREKLSDAKITIAGPAHPDSLAWLDVQDGEILYVTASG